MQLRNYQLYTNCVDLFMENGTVLHLWLNEWSGKIVFRHKINTISNVRHPGICLGYDEFGIWHYMHNHFEHGRPVIESQQGFTKGKPLYVAEHQSQYENSVIIQNGLNEILQARPYDWFNYNCQSFVNKVCYNENKSEAVENWTGGILVGLLVIFGINAINNSK